MPVHTHPLSQAAGTVFEDAVARIGPAAASNWMFRSHAELDGLSPLQAIRAGKIDDVRWLLSDLGKHQ